MLVITWLAVSLCFASISHKYAELFILTFGYERKNQIKIIHMVLLNGGEMNWRKIMGIFFFIAETKIEKDKRKQKNRWYIWNWSFNGVRGIAFSHVSYLICHDLYFSNRFLLHFLFNIISFRGCYYIWWVLLIVQVIFEARRRDNIIFQLMMITFWCVLCSTIIVNYFKVLQDIIQPK